MDRKDKRDFNVRGLIAGLRDHPAFVLSILSVIWMAMRVIAATRGDVTVALGVVAQAGIAQVAAGTLVLTFPALAFVAQVAGVWLLVRPDEPTSAQFLGGGLLLMGVFFLPWPYFLTASVIGFGLAKASAWASEMKGRKVFHWAAAVALIYVGIYFVFDDRPWVPPERLDLVTGDVLVGYVVATDEPWTTVLTEVDRSIRHIPADEIVGRSVCMVSVSEPPTIWQVLLRRNAFALPLVPPCE
jgi:hypothetical protein